jgi:hypothetical protein
MSDPLDKSRYVDASGVSGFQPKERRQPEPPLDDEDLARRIGPPKLGKRRGDWLCGCLGALLGLIPGAIVGVVVSYVTTPYGTHPTQASVGWFLGGIIGALLGVHLGAIIGIKWGAASPRK